MKFSSILPLVLLAPLAVAQVKVTSGSDRITIDIDGKPFSEFVYGGETWKPYLAPLRSASGKIVTRRYPMENVPGEAHDHNHHRGLWFGHLGVNGYDFWSNDPLNKPNPKYGRFVIKKVNAVKSGKKSGSFTATFDWNTPEGHTILTEVRTMTFYSDPKMRVIDFDTTLTPKEKVVFADDKDGWFALRLATPLQEKDNSGVITNAEGLKTEKEAWGKRSNWCDYTGKIDGETVGFAIFDHPANFNHPTRWHVRAYGLFSANPLGSKTFDKTLPPGGMTFEANQPVRIRYRVVIHPENTDLAALYGKYEKGK